MPFYFDDGTEYKPNLYPLPQLCQSCMKKDDRKEKVLCTLTRLDYHHDPSEEFKCAQYELIYKNVEEG